jgi:archaellum component FlaD/FlaE
MAVNQSQVDHIITAASEDDPEVKLQNLEREVDLIKTSIKRLLMDIRERMNEMDNPFTLTMTGAPAGGAGAAAPGSPELGADADEARKSALEAREAALDARESQLDATKAKQEMEEKKESPAAKPESVTPPVQPAIPDEKKALDEQMLALLKSQVAMPMRPPAPAQQATSEKLRLQKVYKLFKWTHQAVRKFGHDRLEIMLESYRVMGYISKESAEEIREISRLMPANLGEEHEVGPDEFVSELYALNRILTPNDTSLDRDMIEVMMEQRQQEPVIMKRKPDDLVDLSGIIPLNERKSSSRNKENDEDWMNLPDRI